MSPTAVLIACPDGRLPVAQANRVHADPWSARPPADCKTGQFESIRLDRDGPEPGIGQSTRIVRLRSRVRCRGKGTGPFRGPCDVPMPSAPERAPRGTVKDADDRHGPEGRAFGELRAIDVCVRSGDPRGLRPSASGRDDATEGACPRATEQAGRRCAIRKSRLSHPVQHRPRRRPDRSAATTIEDGTSLRKPARPVRAWQPDRSRCRSRGINKGGYTDERGPGRQYARRNRDG